MKIVINENENENNTLEQNISNVERSQPFKYSKVYGVELYVHLNLVFYSSLGL